MEAAQRRFRIMTTNYISFAFFFINIYLWKQDISIEDNRIASGALNVLFDIFLCCFAPMAYLCIQIFHLLLPGLLPFVVFFSSFSLPQRGTSDGVVMCRGSLKCSQSSAILSASHTPGSDLLPQRCLWSLTRKILLYGFHFIISTILSLVLFLLKCKLIVIKIHLMPPWIADYRFLQESTRALEALSRVM